MKLLEWKISRIVLPAAALRIANPDELVWKHLKADTVGRMVVMIRPTSLRSGLLHARKPTKKPGEDMLLYQKPLPSICCLNMTLLMD